MANAKIKLLRGNTNNLNSTTNLDPGQPLFVMDKNYLIIGDKSNKKLNGKPITVREVKGYYEDSNGITTSKASEYSFGPSSDNTSTVIKGSGSLNICVNSESNKVISLSQDNITLNKAVTTSSSFTSNGVINSRSDLNVSGKFTLDNGSSTVIKSDLNLTANSSSIIPSILFPTTSSGQTSGRTQLKSNYLWTHNIGAGSGLKSNTSYIDGSPIPFIFSSYSNSSMSDNTNSVANDLFIRKAGSITTTEKNWHIYKNSDDNLVFTFDTVLQTKL